MIKKDKIEILIVTMEEDSFEIYHDIDLSTLSRKKVGFQFGYKMNVEPKSETVIMTLQTYLMNGEKEIGMQSLKAEFLIEPFNSFVIGKTDDGYWEVSSPKAVDKMLDVCVGGLRGMLVKNFKGTSLQGLVIPLLPSKCFNGHRRKRK